ncbi:type II secretion system F family protein [Cohnella cellulosilytica]|uniref:Type II secretion system F family protein n=1 Tax=Cohnella cellulosilytica TaxID=986710 RepID=A0ABW2FIW7_9BACL
MSGWPIALLCAAMPGVYVCLAAMSWRQLGGRRIRLHIDPFAAALRHPAVWKRVLPLLDRARVSLALLNGGACPEVKLIDWAAEGLGLGYLTLTGMSVLALATDTPALLALGAILGAGLPLLRLKELAGQVARRRQSMVMELPELLSKLLLMVNAGENVLRALARTAETRRGASADNPLYTELRAAIASMKRGESLTAALEEWGRRCAVPEAKLFATTVLINARRGGDAFVPALRELTRQMWEKRKAIARTLGEQASSRLAFPLTLVFLLIMVLVGAPAVFMM